MKRRTDFSPAGRFRAVYLGKWKLTWTPGLRPEDAYELYDRSVDPAESRNLYSTRGDVAKGLEGVLGHWLRESTAPEVVPDAADLWRLRSLGYIE